MRKQTNNSFKTMLKQIMGIKSLVPFLALAILFAILGFIVSIFIPSFLVMLGLDAIKENSISVISLSILVILAFSRGLCRYGEHFLVTMLFLKFWLNIVEIFFRHCVGKYLLYLTQKIVVSFLK
ncbi:hypothetical protein HMPREF9318_00291 [Streptococcus urinalis FB127-CNA-2]|nr:hypothetical protein [Streptococcus urinalis]EKS22093.1 hypothetical protein HMPREF9318_00291 [Streptococcus urinalis FB127-CNA-2]VEF31905.1 ABC transporter ATP-binding protein [Streptococcus urinalis]